MSVVIASVEKKSPADKAGIRAGELLLSIDGNEIMDVLDYRFYQSNAKLCVRILDRFGKEKKLRIRKQEYAELGLEFETYLMDKQHTCLNRCIFCFIDQLPKGLRQSLYFKDDDSRLSFLFGNYITLTNLTEHEIERIIKMHISPINISVHTTDPALRVRMMRNKNAGKVLPVIRRFNDAGIQINCQLVLCPGVNDGEALRKTLADLCELENAECIAAVPVGLTGHREGLEKLEPYNEVTAAGVLDILDEYGQLCLKRYGHRRVYGADEFYLLAHREIPGSAFYDDFLQLENGVGLWALLRDEADEALNTVEYTLPAPRTVSMVTGEAAFDLIDGIARRAQEKWSGLTCRVYAVKNHFFGGKITVSGLVTATDILDQLSGRELGEEMLIPSSMLNSDREMFLDSMTLKELSYTLEVPITPVENDGFELIERILGI